VLAVFGSRQTVPNQLKPDLQQNRIGYVHWERANALHWQRPRQAGTASATDIFEVVSRPAPVEIGGWKIESPSPPPGFKLDPTPPKLPPGSTARGIRSRQRRAELLGGLRSCALCVVPSEPAVRPPVRAAAHLAGLVYYLLLSVGALVVRGFRLRVRKLPET